MEMKKQQQLVLDQQKKQMEKQRLEQEEITKQQNALEV
jgi:hypothetical protein